MPDPKLTPKQYVEAGGNKCPSCGSTDIESYGGFEVDSNYATQKVGCNDCPASWQDHYILTEYVALETE